MTNNNIQSNYSSDNFYCINNKIIDNLKLLAKNNNTRRARIILHSTECSDIHEMLIVFEKNSYIRPHKHIGKTESYLVLEGELDLIYFHDNGEVKNVINLSNINSGKTFFLRSENELWHTLLIKSDYVILLETTDGPLNKNSTIFAEWSPDSNNHEKVINFQIMLDNISNNA